MRTPQWIAIGATALLLTLTFLFAQLTDPAKSAPVVSHDADQFSIESYIQAYKSGMVVNELGQVQDLESTLNFIIDPSGKAAVYRDLSVTYDSLGQWVIGGHYLFMLAEQTDSTKDWLAAAERYGALVMDPEMEPHLKTYLTNEAVGAYDMLSEREPGNNMYPIAKAAVYMDGGQDVMSGVTILLGIVEEDPDNADANLLLGRYGIVSGQYDKAIGRLEKVISLQPANAEAYYLLAEAYKETGDIDRAIELFETCKSLVDNEEFKKELDNYISSLKQ